MKSLFVLLLALSCNYKIEKKDLPQLENSGDMTETVSFQQVKTEVFSQKCLACHGNAGGVNLESHASAHEHLDSIRRTALQTKSMPKAPVEGLNNRQYEVLSAWIDAGGPKDPIGHDDHGEGTPEGPEETPVPTPEETSAAFLKIRKEILAVKCLSCHTAGEHAGNIPLGTRNDLISSPLSLVVPGNPDASLIYTITAPGARNMMPPMGVKPLSKVQREMIRAWISKGAP